MSIDQGTETIAIKTEERTWRINIETPKGGDPVVTVHREIVRTGPDGEIISQEPSGSVSRSLSVTAKQDFTIGKKTYTTAEIAGAISVISDTWRTEDITAAAEAATKQEQVALVEK